LKKEENVKSSFSNSFSGGEKKPFFLFSEVEELKKVVGSFF